MSTSNRNRPVILNPSIFINTKVKMPQLIMIDVLKNASEALIFINTGRGYVQTCNCDTIK